MDIFDLRLLHLVIPQESNSVTGCFFVEAEADERLQLSAKSIHDYAMSKNLELLDSKFHNSDRILYTKHSKNDDITYLLLRGKPVVVQEFIPITG